MNAERRAQIAQQVSQVFQRYPGTRIPGPTLASMVARDLSPNLEQWSQTCYDVVEYVEQEIKAGTLNRTKGRKGGIALTTVPDLDIKPVVADAINNHTCPCCGNDRCSKSERTCWKCGGNLH